MFQILSIKTWGFHHLRNKSSFYCLFWLPSLFIKFKGEVKVTLDVLETLPPVYYVAGNLKFQTNHTHPLFRLSRSFVALWISGSSVDKPATPHACCIVMKLQINWTHKLHYCIWWCMLVTFMSQHKGVLIHPAEFTISHCIVEPVMSVPEE